MAYQGKFLVNNAPLSPLTIFGVGTFNAYSGNGIYRNRGDALRFQKTGRFRLANIGLLIGLRVEFAHR